MRREVDEWFWQLTGEMLPITEELTTTRPRVASARFWEPRVDLIEEAGRFLLKADIAGVRAENIQLLYIPERHCMLIRGERPEGDFSDGDRQGVHQLEIYYGEFQREIRLPDGQIDPKGIRAQYRNGFLYVLIPKAGPGQGRHAPAREN
jgi:HSP20 family protein